MISLPVFCWFRMTRYPGKLKLLSNGGHFHFQQPVPDDSLSGEVETKWVMGRIG